VVGRASRSPEPPQPGPAVGGRHAPVGRTPGAPRVAGAPRAVRALAAPRGGAAGGGAMKSVLLALALLQTPAAEHHTPPAAPPPVDTARGATPIPASPWAVGETLTYTAKLRILSLGSGTLEVAGIDTVRGKESFRFRFRLEGKTIVY